MKKPRLNLQMAEVFDTAYPKCVGTRGGCGEGRVTINKASGHVPRGFFGAAGKLSEIELVLVVAEPGDPSADEIAGDLESVYQLVTSVFDPDAANSREGVFHTNVRHILDLCFPNTNFEEQIRKVWFTESVLCSAPKTTGPVAREVSDECGNRFLRQQLELVPNAVIAALGGKAQDRVRRLGLTTDGKPRHVIEAVAAAPPGANHKNAKASWKKIAKAVHTRRA